MNSDDKDRPEPREAHCQCCGGYAGMGRPDPEFCATCRDAGEHLDQDDGAERSSEQCPRCGLKCSTLLDVGQTESGVEFACPSCSRDLRSDPSTTDTDRSESEQ